MDPQGLHKTSFGDGRGTLLIIALCLFLLLGFMYFFFYRAAPEIMNTTTRSNIEGNIQMSELDRLKKENEELRQHITKLQAGENTLPLPVIAYGREELLSENDKAFLERFLLSPYIDYHSADENQLVSMFITAPSQSGEPYEIVSVFETGHRGFLYGKKGEEPDWWLPTCMEPCELTEEFRILYPTIAERIDQ
ncbi:MAG: hypothetical protein ABII02_00415 [Candidatus Magasanikbacteria bacterium]